MGLAVPHLPILGSSPLRRWPREATVNPGVSVLGSSEGSRAVPGGAWNVDGGEPAALSPDGVLPQRALERRPPV